MNVESFARLHPIGYVHVAYAVVWGLHFGYGLWVFTQWRRSAAAASPR
jgi:hypothetical protein